MNLFCNKKCNEVTKKHNGVSTKMLQAQMVKSSSNRRITYNNSHTDNINSIILSGNFEKNKDLLLCYKYNAYYKLLQALSMSHPKLMAMLMNMLNNIINSLTLKEINSIYGIIEPPVIPVVEPTEIIIEKTYYVISRTMRIDPSNGEPIRYFIYKNYSGDGQFVPTYSYKFNLEDSSNIGTELSFATTTTLGIDKVDNVTKIIYEYKNIIRSPIAPGNIGSYIIVTIPLDVSHNKLYTYNRLEPDDNHRFLLWGFSLSYFAIQLDTVTLKGPTFSPIVPRSYEMYINRSSTIKYLTQSSILTAINFYGLNLYIRDIYYDNTTVLYFVNFTYALNIGTYYLFVPPIYKLAFLNKNQTSNFNYVGLNLSTKVTSDVIGTNASDTDASGTDGTYDFYSSTIKITVTGAFDPISLYTLKMGYLGGKDLFVFSTEGPIIDQTFTPRLIDI
jgi:hypothetical protein